MVRRKNNPEWIFNQRVKYWECHERNAKLVSPIRDARVDVEPSSFLADVIAATTYCPECRADDCIKHHERKRRNDPNYYPREGKYESYDPAEPAYVE
jgi:hypothetical protein